MNFKTLRATSTTSCNHFSIYPLLHAPMPPSLSTPRKEEIEPHSPTLLRGQEHDKRFPTKTKVTQQSFLPGWADVLEDTDPSPTQFFLFHAASPLQSLESLSPLS